MNAQPALEGKLDELLTKVGDTSSTPQVQFAEPTQDGFAMPSIGSFLKVSNANLVVIALGVIMSSTMGGFISGMFPSMGRYATIIAGAVLLLIFKSGVARDFASGVLIGGLSQMFAGIGSSLGGYIGGGGQNDMGMGGFAENRVTFGGTDGTTVTSPDRRVLS